jgi:hypothetical protein
MKKATIGVEMHNSTVLKGKTGIWSASGSPFKSLNGVLREHLFKLS